MTGIGFGDGSPSIGKSYTADGLTHTVVSNGSTWTFTYNNHRQLTQESLNLNSTVYNIGWGYDANAHVSQLTYPDGTVVAYSPNALGEATAASGYATAVTYQPNGAIAGYTLANGIVHSQTQNVRGLPAVNTDVGMLQDAYTYDSNGNVTAITDQLAGITTRSMTYDGLNRLTAANDPNVWGSGSYSYDPLDNVRTSVVGTRNSAMNYDTATNRLTGIVTNGVTSGYTYDNQGNITARGSESFTFDQANRLKQATGIESYTYDGLGRRTSINGTNGVNRVHIYDQAGQLLWWVQTNGTTTQFIRYVYLGKTPIAATSSTSGTNFMHTDALGSTVANSLPSGGLISRTRYEAYGRVASGTAPTGLGFTGQVNDPSTGLVYMQQRYYDPLAGRFLSVDPIATDGNAAAFNRYVYVSNDPLGRIDPNGEWDECGHSARCVVLDFTGLWTAGQALAADAAYLNAILTNNVDVQNQVAQELADNKGDLYKTLGEFAAGYGAGKVAAWAFDAWAASGAAQGLTAASGTGGERLPMTVVKMLPKGTAGGIVDEARALTFATGNEHSRVRLATGERALVSGGPGGISFSEGQITRIIGHTHPYGFGSIGPSGADFDALSALGQTHSYVLDGAGQIIRFGP